MILKEFCEDFYELYIKEDIISVIDISNKSALEKLIKNVTFKLKNIYDITINGIYSLKLYISSGYGAFIVASKLDSLFSKDSIDFRVEIILNCTFYYKTDDFFMVKDSKTIYAYNNYYYIEIENLKRKIDYCEFGEIVYDEFLKIKDKCLKI